MVCKGGGGGGGGGVGGSGFSLLSYTSMLFTCFFIYTL